MDRAFFGAQRGLADRLGDGGVGVDRRDELVERHLPADGECAPCDAVEAVLRPLSGRILLPAPAYERFVAKRSSVDVK